MNHLSHKLVKAYAMLFKLCHYVNEITIKSIYYAIFHSHLSYVCTAWGQNLNPKHRINLLQKKAMRIIIFARHDAHTSPIFAVFPTHMNKTLDLHHMVFWQNQHAVLQNMVLMVFAASAIASWNFFQNKFPSNNLRQISYSQLKVLIKNYFFNF